MSDTNERSVASVGSVVGKPVAWAVGGPDGPHVFWSREDASKYMRETLSDNLMCLYKHNTLLLTDEERAALRTVIGGFGMWVAQNGLADDESLRLAVVTLRGLLERHCPTPEKRPVQDNTPDTHTNPAKGSVQDSVT